MSGKINDKTKAKLTDEYKKIRQRCIDSCNIIESEQLEVIKQENISQKTVAYIEGLRTEIQNSNTAIPSDKNLMTCLYLTEMQKNTEHLEELTSFTKGAICDTANEIERLQNLIAPVKEALSKPRIIHRSVRPEHLQKAKETFKMMKNELRGLIQSLFPHLSEHIIEFLGQLMQEKLNEETNGYIQITDENYAIVEMLSDISIITTHPYDKNKVKLAF